MNAKRSWLYGHSKRPAKKAGVKATIRNVLLWPHNVFTKAYGEYAKLSRRQKWGFVGVMLIASVISSVGTFALNESDNHPAYYANGQEQITPTAEYHVVYVKDARAEIRCTATTADGQTLHLPPHTDGRRIKDARPRGATFEEPDWYWAVAVLPTDRGPLTVTCPAEGRLWVAGPGTANWPVFLFMGLTVAFSAVLVVVAVIARCRRQRETGPPS